MNEELRLLQEQIYAIPPRETKESDLDDSATVAIPKNVLSSSARKGLRGTEPEPDTDNADNTVGADASSDEPDTAAIPQRGAADTQQSEQPEQRKQTKQSDQSASSNPRAGWR